MTTKQKATKPNIRQKRERDRSSEYEEFLEYARRCRERTDQYLRNLHAPDGQQCEAPCPFQDLGAWCKPCVRRKVHGGMHYNGTGWWSDEQAAEEVERIAQSVHDA